LTGFVLIFGLMVFFGAIADSSGTLRAPGPGATILLALVVIMASLLVYLDNRGSQRRGK
jgi:hypothetical protein